MKPQPLIDTRPYSVWTDAGGHRGWYSREAAISEAAKLREQAKRNGWNVRVRIYYRDGSLVTETT